MEVEQQQFADLNAGFVQELFAQYLAAPEAVDPEWRALFESGTLLVEHPLLERIRELAPGALDGGHGGNGVQAATVPPATAADQTLLGAVAAAMSLVKAHRTHGHLAARLDPLG